MKPDRLIKSTPLKYILLAPLLIALHFCCKAQNQFTDTQQKEFEETVRTFQTKYVAGNDNCEYIINFIDKNVKMSEARFSEPAKNFTYQQLKQFCPHLPKKLIIETITEQRLLSPQLGYDFVSQLYLRKSLGDTVRETTSRIWEHKDGIWKIIQLNTLLSKVCD